MLTLITTLVFAMLGQITPAAPKEDPKKAMDEIIQVSKKWVVEETVGSIKYKILLTLNGKATGMVGTLTGTAKITYKKKPVTVTLNIRLIKSRYRFITRYPALSTLFSGTMSSSDSAYMPLKERVRQRETLILKKSQLCPKSDRFTTKCLKPLGK